MRLGIFGGSFNPVHYGHLLLAECCREECKLDEVWLMPAATAPHKQGQMAAPAKDRVEMLKLALGAHESIRVSTLEIDRGGVSYTLDTLQRVRAAHPQAALFLLLGGDSLMDLPHWHKPKAICELATPVVAARPDSPPVDYEALVPLLGAERVDDMRRSQVQMPEIGLSSTDLRRRLAEGKSIRFRTPRAVEKYIETHGLYRRPE